MDVNAVLLDILFVLVAAKIAAEIADRVGIPAVVGEIAAGILVGPSVLGLVEPNEVLHTLAELGVILLLLEVGMEMDLRELRSVGRASLLVAVVGVVVPMLTGIGAGLALGFDGDEALFVGAALTATSVGITARVFGDLRALASIEARTVLGAAVADDVLGLVILTVVTRIVTGDGVSALTIATVIGAAVLFVVVGTFVGLRAAPPLFAGIRRHSRSTGTLVALALAFTLGFAEVAHAADLAPIIGAFVAGLALARTSAAERVRGELMPVGHLLIPVFFLQIGIDADVEAFADPKVLGIAAVLLVVGVLGKLVAAAGMLGRPGDRLLVGIGMVPRGEVGLIFATLGLREGVFGQDVYGALLLVVLATTVGTPPALRWRLMRLRARSAAAEGGRGNDDGELVRALAVCRSAETGTPAADDLAWLGELGPGPLRWDDAARAELWTVLEQGGARSWRLLAASGVLQRALPELDDVLAHRRRGLDVDPLDAFRFRRLDAVREVTRLPAVLLAALVVDACDEGVHEPASVAGRTVQRLGLAPPAERIVAALVQDADLLAAAARRVDGLEPRAVLQLAMHFGSEDVVDALYLLTSSTFVGEEWERERLDELYLLVRNALASDEAGRRREQACAATADPDVRERIQAAPREYVLGRSVDELVRDATLCEPPPARDDVRVAVQDRRVSVVATDRVGLLAIVARALEECGADVVAATAVTWGDRTALSSFVLAAPAAVDGALAARIVTLLDAPLEADPVPEVGLHFDDAGSPWYTRCSVESPDHPGLLRSVTTAFAACGVDVHAAHVATHGGAAVDTFELSRGAAKLDDATKERIRATVAEGVAPRRRRRLLRSGA